jgi:hypothetical protein
MSAKRSAIVSCIGDIVPAGRGIKLLCDVLPGGTIPVAVRQMAQ